MAVNLFENRIKMVTFNIALICFVFQLFQTEGTFTWENCGVLDLHYFKTVNYSTKQIILPNQDLVDERSRTGYFNFIQLLFVILSLLKHTHKKESAMK